MTSLIGRKRTFREAEETTDAQDDEKKNGAKLSNSNNNNKNNSNNNSKGEGGTSSQSDFSAEYLQAYYDRLFPYLELFNWLSYFGDKNKNSKYWKNREFSFTLEDDIYIRFQSFDDLSLFKKEIRRKKPFKIDIGAVYNIEPKRKNTISNDKFIAEEKELVFDIDISDYDDVRTCCQEASICSKCWPLMSCAIKVTDTCLRQDFGFSHIVWVFSGRRGIHCWVSDEICRKLDTIGRSAIIDYLKLYSGNLQNRIKVNLDCDKLGYIHESHNRAYDICKEYFLLCSLMKQKLLDTPNGIDYLCNQVRDSSIGNQLKNQLLKVMNDDIGMGTSIGDDNNNDNNNDNDEDLYQIYKKQWDAIDSTFENYINQAKTSKDKRRLKSNQMEIVFSYVYPRLDVEVSRHKNHLLKCPFVIHPKTGKVCTIIDPKYCDQFDPLNQPVCIFSFSCLVVNFFFFCYL